jgi:hypothetical protein
VGQWFTSQPSAIGIALIFYKVHLVPSPDVPQAVGR